jgi:translation initiation factor IF-2
MAIKLIKACKELNIGMATLTAWCEKNNHAVESDPNFRISDDLYLLLAKEFNKDMAVKIEADRQAAERAAKEEAARAAAEAEAKAKAEQEAARAAAEAARREAARVAEQKAAEAAEAAKKAAEEKAKKAAQAETKPAEPAQPAQPEKPKKEIFTLGKPELKDGPKVLGKIDLDSIDTSTRPAKKTKEQKRKEREERQQAQQAQQQAAAEKRKRERIKNNAAKVDPNDKRNQTNKSGKNKNKPREATQEEVEKALKETLSRLQQKQNKSNTSKYKRERREQEREKHELEMMEAQEQSKVLKLTEFVTANDLAVMMNVPVNKIIGTCMSLGLFVSINQRLDAETINLVAEEFGFTTEYVSAHVVEEINADEVVNEEDVEPRCPIITVMGHVDHGKTSLLDHIRNANVIAGEAGGITQHIGAYNVKLKNGQHITFLDTPGHAAFTAMRARGAKVTDIAIIIIAADDAVMPQTIEAINHAQAAGVPMVFAINKVDKPGANPDKIREQLSNMNILVEDWGGKYQCQEISAKKGTGVYELLEKVLLEAEMLDLKANPKRRAKGSVIESSLDKGRGYVATLLVQDGTLHMGDIVLAGTFHGRIKAMFNERGQKITEVRPGEPCSILGLNGAPQAGDEFNVIPTEQEARDIANKREQLQREQSIRTKKHVGLEEIGRRLAIGDFKELNIIVKADVDGSVEAIKDSLIKLSTENIQVNVIHGAVGAISDSDVMLAAASDAIIVGFNVRPTGTARKMAETEEVDIRIYSIIYDAINEVKAAMEGLLAPEVKEEVTATLEVLQTFHISKVGTIAGCIVREGKIKRGNKVRVIRDGIVIKTTELASLKHVKDDIKEAGVNTECGLSLKAYDDLKEGDILESFDEIEVAKTL